MIDYNRFKQKASSLSTKIFTDLNYSSVDDVKYKNVKKDTKDKNNNKGLIDIKNREIINNLKTVLSKYHIIDKSNSNINDFKETLEEKNNRAKRKKSLSEEMKKNFNETKKETDAEHQHLTSGNIL